MKTSYLILIAAGVAGFYFYSKSKAVTPAKAAAGTATSAGNLTTLAGNVQAGINTVSSGIAQIETWGPAPIGGSGGNGTQSNSAGQGTTGTTVDTSSGVLTSGDAGASASGNNDGVDYSDQSYNP